MAGAVRFELTQEDIIAGQRLWLLSYLKRRTMVAMLGLLGLIFAGAVTSAVLAVSDGTLIMAALKDVLVPLIAPVAFVALQVWAWWRVRRNVQTMVKQQPSLLSQTIWQWDDASATISSNAGTSNIPWDQLHRWLKNKTSLLLCPQERMILVLPRHALTPEAETDLIGTLQRFATAARTS